MVRYKPSADLLGFTDEGDYLQGVSFEERHSLFTTYFSPLLRWEFGRRLRPNGPLSQSHLTDALLNRWSQMKDPRQISHELHKLTCSVASKAEMAVPVPKALDNAFWNALADAGGEDVATSSGYLSFQIHVDFQTSTSSNRYFRIIMAPPVLENSRKLWRMFRADRLLRVRVDQEFLWKLQDPLLFLDPADLDCFQAQKRKDAQALSEAFRRTFFKPIHILDGKYRLFYGKPGSRTLLFWSEESLHELYEPVPVPEFLDSFMPLHLGKNPSLSLAKYAARIALFDSQTIPVGLPEIVSWVPDLTSHTLPIHPLEMARLAQELKLSYVPSCISGFLDGQLCSWSSHYGENCLQLFPDQKRIAIFSDRFAKIPRKRGQLTIEFFVYLGTERLKRTITARYMRADIHSWQRPEHEEVVTSDGNGLLSWEYAQRIHATLGLQGEAVSTAYQARLGGCKGMWSLLPSDFDTEDRSGEWIQIRSSQHKCDVKPDVYSFDVVRRSTPSSGGAIGPQALEILRQVNENKSCRTAIEAALEALREASSEEADSAYLEEGDPATLLAALERSCQSSSNSTLGALRANHYRDAEQDLPEVFEHDVTHPMHPYTGRPLQWEAQVKMLLLAGFPPTHPLVRARLQRIREIVTKQDLEVKCPVPRSRHAFALVDHTGLLEPGQVFFQSSAPMKDPYSDRQLQSVLTGQVLLNRSPTAQATDWQLCEAVNLPELANLFDVVVCSAKGPIPFMSKLSGGDYDGDMVDIIWEPRLTQGWENAPDAYLDIPFNKSAFFSPQAVQVGGAAINTVAELQELLSRPGGSKTGCIQEALMLPFLLPTAFGKLSVLHTDLLAQRGLCNRVTVAVGHLYTLALDAAKQGLRFRHGHLESARLQELITVTLAGDEEVERLRLKALSSDSDPDAPDRTYRLTPMQPTQGLAYKSVKLGHKAGRLSSASKKHIPTTSSRPSDNETPSPAKSLLLPEPSEPMKMNKDEDLADLWLSACGPEKVYAKETGTAFQRMKYFAQTQFDEYRKYRLDMVEISKRNYEDMTIRQTRLANIFITKLWKQAQRQFEFDSPDVPAPYVWRHLLISCIYEVGSRLAESQRAFAALRDDLVLLIGHKFVCDMKAASTTKRMLSTSLEKDTLGPTMVNFFVLNSKKEKRYKPILKGHEPDSTIVSPKRKMTVGSPTTPSKKLKQDQPAVENAWQGWTPSKREGRRMEVEVTPRTPTPSSSFSSFVKITNSDYISDEEQYWGNFGDALDTEEDEVLEEISELLRYRASGRLQDSGMGGSQEQTKRCRTPESPCKPLGGSARK